MRACERCKDKLVVYIVTHFGKPPEPALIDVTPEPRYEPAPINFVNFNFGVESKPEPAQPVIASQEPEQPARTHRGMAQRSGHWPQMVRNGSLECPRIDATAQGV